MIRPPARRILTFALMVALLLAPAPAWALPPLCDPPGDGITRAMTAAYTHGVSTTVSATGIGALAGSPTAAKPVRFTLAKAAAVSAAGTITVSAQSAVYRATGFTTDTLTGVTFESGTDQDFTSGDWIGFASSSQYTRDINARLRNLARSTISVLDSGTVAGDGVTNDGPAIQAIITANPGRRIYFPRTATATDISTSYECGTTTLTVTHPGTTLEGDGGGYQGGTVLHWAAKTPGVWLQASGCCVRDLCLFGSGAWSGVHYDEGIVPARRYPGLTEAAGADPADGVRVGAPYCHLSDLNIQYFGRDGVNGSAADQDLAVGLGAEDCQFDRMFVGNCRGDGLRVQGGDSNVSQCNGSTFFVNQFWGIDASDFLSFAAVSPQATNNGQESAQQLAGGGDRVLAIATLVRASNTVTLTWTAPYLALDSTPLHPGDGVRITSCPNDPSFVGRWRILTVAGDNTSLTFTQVAANTGTIAGGSGQGTWIPPDQTITSATRSANVVTVVFPSAPLTDASGHQALSGQPFQVGQGVSLYNCADATFNGTFVVLSVTNANKTITYAQTAANATTTGSARMAMPYDVWQLTWAEPSFTNPQPLWGGSFRSPFGTAPSVWINPYSEGGQRLRLGSANVVIAPTWSDPNVSTDIGEPLILYGTSPNTGSPGTSLPLGVVHAADAGVTSLTRIGLTAPQLHTDYFQHPIAPGGVANTFWTQVRGQDEWSLWRGDPATGSHLLRFRLDTTAGYTYLQSEGSGMVRVNADAGSGTGGLLIGDGTGGASTTAIVGGNITATGLVRTAATATGSRPTATAVGQQTYDTTLHLPLWWSGSDWRDAAGTAR